MTLAPNRHARGWPKVALLTWIELTDQTWRYCIEPMGRRDDVWVRRGYVELIQWVPLLADKLDTVRHNH